MRVVIVEDEIRIREGIINLIKKNNREHIIAGAAENGLRGLELIEQTRPDLVITDIKMNEMDGLEMLHKLKERNIPVKVIVLSAYSDFDYAKQAIKLGVNEYLLKPISVNELTQALNTIEIQLTQEDKDTRNPEEIRTQNTIFYSLLLGGITADSKTVKYLKDSYNLDENSSFILIMAYLGNHYEENHKKIIREFQTILKEKALKYSLLKVAPNNAVVCIIYSCTEEQELERWFQNRVLLHIKRDKTLEACFGWIRFKGINELRSNYQILQKNMDWNIVLGDDIMVTYPKVNKIQTLPLSYPIEIENRMRTALCTLDNKKLELSRKDFCNHFRKGNIYSPKEIKECFVRFLWSMINVSKEIDYGKYENFEQQEYLKRLMAAITLNELEETLIHFISQFTEKESAKDAISFTIQRAKSLVHEFYNQGITLDEIAAKLNLTPEYLGTQFHKEMGINFSSYIKNFRIKKAKELLIGTHLKLYEVADKSGYGDPKYFSQVFKEATGFLPTEYRKMYK
ncbi:response regulator [Anaerocolumna sp. AGMB13025]|uniref:response regulator transcription factor n=1 Tax=Anaerocolumna sp. AGMB13025 TaxID=3039116 RepID=UPI00241D3148|nr:response regulator [Anaerocolumna sp. AGMB13025]WFR58646.1 response regulator [Anaerocolumna sp. AGMB13025]